MLIVGITGGIGSGKSTATQLFAELGVTIIDADTIAKDILSNNTPLQQEVIAHFGDTVLDEHKQLRRDKLRDIIFADPKQKLWLESLLHPLAVQEIQARVNQLTDAADADQNHTQVPYCMIAIPLLVEVPASWPLINRVLVIDVDEKTQLARTMLRDQLSADQVQAIMNAQASRQQRLDMADDVIHNDGDLTALKEQVQTIHQRYLALANMSPSEQAKTL
jgi:dephospho-CoA kinase